MFSPRTVLTFAAAAALAGCSTIFNAREAQKAVEGKGQGASAAEGRVRLEGASLESLVSFALTNRPSVASARLAVDEARLSMKALAADAPVISDSPWTGPKLSVSGGYNESSTGSKFRDHDWEMSGSASAAVSLELLVYDFGRYSARARQQAEKTVAAEMALVEEGYLVFNDVADAYFNFYERRSLLEVALTNEMQYAEHLARAEEKRKAGEAHKLDILKARLDLANAHQTVVAASNLVDTTGATLMNALGVDASRGTWETVLGREPVGTDSVRRGFARTEYAVDDTFAFARTNAPSVRIRRAQLRAASHAVDYAVADMLPSVSVSGSLNWTDPLWYWRWGASVVQSMGYRRPVEVDRAVVAMKSAEAALDESEQRLSVELETAIANRDNSASAIQSAVASLKSAKENLATVKEQFSIGDVSRIELSDAIAAYSAAAGDCIRAFYDGQRAEAKLFAIVGRYPEYREEVLRGEK